MREGHTSLELHPFYFYLLFFLRFLINIIGIKVAPVKYDPLSLMSAPSDLMWRDGVTRNGTLFSRFDFLRLVIG